MRTVLISGAAGFLGGHVVREATAQGVKVRALQHHRPVDDAAAHSVVAADLTEPASLRGVCEDVDAVLHCASYIGPSPAMNERVNALGTRNLAAEARRAGVERLVYISTASVYGRGSFRDASARLLPRAPGSPTSRSRAAAEDEVLASGGVVLRPHLVFGAGDEWLGPGVSRLTAALPGSVDGWSALASVISAEELARLVVAVALAPTADLTAQIYHAAWPDPIRVKSLVSALDACADRPAPTRDLPCAQARELVQDDPAPLHALSMLTADHWFDSKPLWRDLRLSPGPGFDAEFARVAHWYRQRLAARQRGHPLRYQVTPSPPPPAAVLTAQR